MKGQIGEISLLTPSTPNRSHSKKTRVVHDDDGLEGTHRISHGTRVYTQWQLGSTLERERERIRERSMNISKSSHDPIEL